MKKLVYGVLAIAAIGMFAACQKDGKYNPKEKIANVYEEGMSIWSYTPDGEQWVSDTSITPKYLSEIIKQVSHQTPNEWIDTYVTLELRNLLKNTSKSIKEITEDLRFANQSFLGKYFKEGLR